MTQSTAEVLASLQIEIDRIVPPSAPLAREIRQRIDVAIARTYDEATGPSAGVPGRCLHESKRWLKHANGIHWICNICEAEWDEPPNFTCAPELVKEPSCDHRWVLHSSFGGALVERCGMCWATRKVEAVAQSSSAKQPTAPEWPSAADRQGIDSAQWNWLTNYIDGPLRQHIAALEARLKVVEERNG